MPIAQEGIEKVSPTMGNAAKEIAKGVKLLEEVTNAGLEGAIPRLIAEAVNEANFIYNTNEVTLYWVAVHCNHLYNN